MEVAVIAERKQVQLQTLALHHATVGDIKNADFRKVRLSGDGTQRGELRAEELHPIIIVWVPVLERL